MSENKSELEELIEQRTKLEKELQSMIENDNGMDYEEQDEDAYMSSPDYIIYETSHKIDSLSAKIGEIYYKQEKELYKQKYDEVMVNYSQGSVISDLMNTEDIFNRIERATTLAQYIVDKTTHVPFNIGIFARWGEGKTTFLNYLQKQLENFNVKDEKKNSEKFNTYIVNYDASEYEEKDKIWASIMRAMFLQYEKTTWFPKFFYSWKKVLYNKKKFSTYILSYMLSFTIVCVLSAYSLNTLFNDWNKEWKVITSGGSAIMAIIILTTKLLVPITKKLLQSSVPLSEKIINNISLPNYVDKLGERENIKKDLSILVDAWVYRWRNQNKRIVLIIDELDRCSEKGIIEFFQSMQLFLKVPQVIIIFAIDQEYLKKALSNFFKITGEKELEDFLREYLDKYINMPVSLDTQINYLTYIDYLLNNVERKEAYFAISDGEKESIKAAIETIPIAILTPRKVKKLVNILIISKETCVLLNKKSNGIDIIDFRDYIFWFLFSYFYEEAAKKILTYSKQYQKYNKIKYLLSKISKENRENLIINIDNKQIIELIDDLVLIDIYKYERVLSGFTKII